MGNLKSTGFRVLGTCLVAAGLYGVTSPAHAIGADRWGDVAHRDAFSRHVVPAQQTASDSIHNIQRLLKLLADRYHGKYGTVDPGRVDGTMRAETRIAIKRFREISGTASGAQSNEQLVTAILAAMAEMSATQPEDKGETNIAAPAEASPAAATADAATGSAGKETAAGQSPAGTAAGTDKPGDAAPAPPVSRVETAQAKPESPGISRPVQRAGDGRVYFAQTASLKTLEAAKREWQRILGENRAALAGGRVYFEEAMIEGRGTFYRVLIGPIEEREAAKALCTSLRENNQPCVVMARNAGELSKELAQGGIAAAPASPGAGGSDQKSVPPRPQDPVKEQAAVPAIPSGDAGAKAGPAVESGKTGTDGGGSAGTRETISKGPGISAEGSALRALPESKPTPAPAESAATPAPAGKPADPQPEPPAPETARDAANTAKDAGPTPTAVTPPPASPAGANDNAAASPTLPLPPVALKPPSRTTESTPQVDYGDFHAKAVAESAVAANKNKSAPARRDRPAGLATRLVDALYGAKRPMGLTVAVILGAGILLLLWRRRNRRPPLAQFLQPGNFALARRAAIASEPVNTLAALENDFESEQLRRSRSIRDDFLRDILGDQFEAENAPPKEESAIRINSGLKALLASDPAQYKLIFLNLVFLSNVGAALNQSEITMGDLNGHFSREFKILQNYFKIHVLELDDRHRIRKQLPGLFYCLQLAQQRQRHTEAGRRVSPA